MRRSRPQSRRRVRLRLRYGRRPGRVQYHTRPLSYYAALAAATSPSQRAAIRRRFASRRAENIVRAARISRYARNAPAYRRLSTAAGVRSFVSRYANRVRGRLLARRVAAAVGRRTGTGNYIGSFL